MCGIIGIYNYNAEDISDEEFDVFVDSLEHRGPDGRGVFKDKDVFFRLGHRRLSILDLSKQAAQPMPCLNGRYWISYNGEIYNFLELRSELIKYGYSFKSDSDTEVILNSYIHWKEDCQLKFNGMWAFAIWDSKEKTLFLSRDRFGVKPLHYYLDNKQLIFTSEMKSFCFLKEPDVSFDEQMVMNSLFNPCGWHSTEYTLLNNVKNLQAGHCAIFNDEKKMVIKKWWNTLDHLIEVPSSNEQVIEQFRDIFFDACRIRMRSDVPLASALSGGLDSSSIVCSMFKIVNDEKYQKDRLSEDWQRVFTATFPNTCQDEYLYAKNVVDHVKAKAYYYEVDRYQCINNLEKVIYDFETIFDPPVGPWHIYKEYRKNNHAISIDGHGADELLGGYHHYSEELMHKAIDNNNIIDFHKMYKIVSSLLVKSSYVTHNTYSYRKILKTILSNKIKKRPVLHKIIEKCINKFFRFKNSEETSAFSIPTDWLLIKPKHYDFDKEIDNNSEYQKLDYLSKLLYMDFHYYSLPVILRNFDRSSMSHGVEIRAPFLDWRIVTFLFSLNQSYKINKGYTKLMLRQAMQNILPESIRTRKTKIGFANPIFEWFERYLRSYIYDNVNSKSFMESSIWNGKKIKEYIDRCYQVKNYGGLYRFWLCIIANVLMEKFKMKKGYLNKSIVNC